MGEAVRYTVKGAAKERIGEKEREINKPAFVKGLFRLSDECKEAK